MKYIIKDYLYRKVEVCQNLLNQNYWYKGCLKGCLEEGCLIDCLVCGHLLRGTIPMWHPVHRAGQHKGRLAGDSGSIRAPRWAWAHKVAGAAWVHPRPLRRCVQQPRQHTVLARHPFKHGASAEVTPVTGWIAWEIQPHRALWMRSATKTHLVSEGIAPDVHVGVPRKRNRNVVTRRLPGRRCRPRDAHCGASAGLAGLGSGVSKVEYANSDSWLHTDYEHHLVLHQLAPMITLTD